MKRANAGRSRTAAPPSPAPIEARTALPIADQVRPVEDTRQVEIIGHLRLKEIERLIRARFPEAVVPSPFGRDYLRAALSCFATKRRLRGFARRFTPDIPPAILDSLTEEWGQGALRLQADDVARILRIPFDERQRLGLRTIGACDLTYSERQERALATKRQRDREKQRAKRRSAGRKTREDFIAESVAEEAGRTGLNRSTIYRRKQRAKAMQQVCRE